MRRLNVRLAGPVALSILGVAIAFLLFRPLPSRAIQAPPPPCPECTPTVKAAAGHWRPAANLSAGRARFPLTVLHNGNVLASAGYQGPYSEVNSEVYDPGRDLWFPTGNMTGGDRVSSRMFLTATLVSDGTVLVAGGLTEPGVSLAISELYDPGTNSWSRLDDLTEPTSSHSATLLPNGKVLVAGGLDCQFVYGCDSLNSIEVYDPVTRKWSAGKDMNEPRGGHTASLLPNGRVLVTGGYHCQTGERGGTCTLLATSELYNPETDSWSSAAGLSSGRAFHSAVMLTNGNMIVIGGDDGSGDGLQANEIYDYRSNSWRSGGNMSYGRIDHAATLLPNGKVLVTGGYETHDSFATPLSSVELYDPATNIWTIIDPLITSERGHAAALLRNGEVLVAGGYQGREAERLSPGITHAR